MRTREPLSEARIIEAAVRVADAGGYTAISMRNVGKELGVEAMSLYHHVTSKDALLDALVDSVFAQIELPGPGMPWREGMRLRAASARNVLVSHPWATDPDRFPRDPRPCAAQTSRRGDRMPAP